MADWQAIAVFVALGTWLLTMFFSKPLKWLRGWISRAVLNQFNECEAVLWNDLSMVAASRSPSTWTDAIAWNNTRADPTSGRMLATPAFLGVIEMMFSARPKRVERPTYLEETKRYIRTDSHTLLAFMLSSSTKVGGGGGRSDNSGPHSIFSLSVGSVSGRFHRHHDQGETYIVGRMLGETPITNWEIARGFYGLPKESLRRIASGYPPFYRDRITTHSGVNFAHPATELRDACRAGWIIAIGLSIHEPVYRYNGSQIENYRTACKRVQKTIEKAIWPCFGSGTESYKVCKDAFEAILTMNNNESGSGLPSWTRGTAFSRCHRDNPEADPLSVEDCRFAIKLFNANEEKPLTDDQRMRLDPMLVPVLCAGINGIYKWWQYRNNEGGVLPWWLVDDAAIHTAIWIET